LFFKKTVYKRCYLISKDDLISGAGAGLGVGLGSPGRLGILIVGVGIEASKLLIRERSILTGPAGISAPVTLFICFSKKSSGVVKGFVKMLNLGGKDVNAPTISSGFGSSRLI
jgi:hypothetical protein